MNVEKGNKLASELPGWVANLWIQRTLITDRITSIKFVRCDVTNWDDQVTLFRTAASMTSSGEIDHVVANAGIAVDDEVFSYDGTSSVSMHGLTDTDHKGNRPRLPFQASEPQDN